MAELVIRTFGDPVLRQRSREVERVTDAHRRLAEDMLQTMRIAPGVGLAAPQVGIVERIFTWEVDEEHGVVVNPVIVKRSRKKVEGEEGCLSLPGLVYPVERHESVRVEGLDELGRHLRIDAEGFRARVFQHEIDHLDGILFIDRLPDELRRQARKLLTDQVLGLPPRERAAAHLRAAPPGETL